MELKCVFCHMQFRDGDWVNPVLQDDLKTFNNFHDKCFADTLQGRMGYSFPKGRYQFETEPKQLSLDFIATRFGKVE